VLQENLEGIAGQYHLAPQPDAYIEEAYQDHEIKWLKEHASGRERILDLGLGDGRVFTALTTMRRQPNLEIHFVEASSALTEKYQTTDPGIFIHNTLFEDFAPGFTFDLIIASHVFEHVADPKALVSSLQALLSSKGILLVIVPNADSLHRLLAVEIGVQKDKHDLSPRDHLVGHRRVYDLPWLKSEFDNSDLIVIQERGFFVKPFSNAQLMEFPLDLIEGLIRLGDQIPAGFCANVALALEKE
jgi:SAM-dependent methyltransferase